MRIEQLTFTRFIAAMSIVIYHYGENVAVLNNEYFSFIFSNANVGVSFFFVLSGFVMMIAYGHFSKINFADYMKNRLARIYPVYFFAVLLLFMTYLVKFRNGIITEDILYNIFMIQSWIPGKATSFNYPAWSLSVELIFYLSFPIFFNYLLKKISTKYLLIISLLFWIVSQIFVHVTIEKEILKVPFYSYMDLLYHPLLHMNEFLIGAVAGLIFIKKKTQSNNILVILILITLLILILKFPIGINYHNGFLAIIFIPLIFFISTDNSFVSKFLSKKIFVFLGEISYGIYILQFPVYILIMKNNMLLNILTLDESKDVNKIFFIYIVSLISISSLVYIYLEKPMRDFIKTKMIWKRKSHGMILKK